MSPFDPGYGAFQRTFIRAVLLNGQQIENVLTADEERGFVECISEGTEWEIVQLKGKVEIVTE